jgi:hypothetical protein
MNLAMNEVRTHNFCGDIYALIAQVVMNPTVMRSGTTMTVLVHGQLQLYTILIFL